MSCFEGVPLDVGHWEAIEGLGIASSRARMLQHALRSSEFLSIYRGPARGTGGCHASIGRNVVGDPRIVKWRMNGGGRDRYDVGLVLTALRNRWI